MNLLSDIVFGYSNQSPGEICRFQTNSLGDVTPRIGTGRGYKVGQPAPLCLLSVALNHDFLLFTFCSSACMASPSNSYNKILYSSDGLAPGSRRSGSQKLTLCPPSIPHHSLLQKKKSTLFLFLNSYLNVVPAPLLLQLS